MRGRRFVAFGLIIAAVALIIMGVAVGEVQEVFQKAIHLCLECIGLG